MAVQYQENQNKAKSVFLPGRAIVSHFPLYERYNFFHLALHNHEINGWAYLVAVIDWYSRYVISWRLSNTLEIEFCLDCLNEALDNSQYKPDIFNSDQGSHFTSRKFTGILENKKIQISMDGRGRYLDNIFVERLWRSVKQENIYLNSYQDVRETKIGLNEYFPFYNYERRHESLNYLFPAEIYFK